MQVEPEKPVWLTCFLEAGDHRNLLLVISPFPSSSLSLLPSPLPRLVNEVLAEELKHIHAFEQRTLTPEQWAKEQEAK